MRSVFSSSSHILCAALLATLAAPMAAPQDSLQVVEVKTVLGADGVRPGKTIKIAALVRIAPGFHINDHKPTLDYLIPTEWKLEPPNSISVERVVYPKGQLKKFAFSDMPLSVYEGSLTVGALLRVAPTVRPGAYTLNGKFNYQACNDHACLPPKSLPVTLSVNVVARGTPLKPLNTNVFSSLGELEPARKSL
jgi:DsbC/DsbD-like thiol-disulfide interchange protein